MFALALVCILASQPGALEANENAALVGVTPASSAENYLCTSDCFDGTYVSCVGKFYCTAGWRFVECDGFRLYCRMM
ncbi:MAG TPA: hypothetical protein VE685_00945 [Thermoanaerobaculia bacterium]|nr:hypothetical protein [Thermoanaerobaculia bacterium]